MKIFFNKDICADLEEGIKKEWLEINPGGVFACTNIYGMNTRQYHGLYVTPGMAANDRFVLLSKFEESVFIDKQVFEISTNSYVGGIYPQGYKYLESFSMDPFPRFTYRIENRRIEKTVFLLSDKNILITRYTNKNQGPPVKIILKPVLAGRKINELARESQNVNVDSYFDGKVVKINPTPETPELKIYYTSGDYAQAPLWYYNFRYGGPELNSGSRGDVEDLFNTGFFTCILKAYDSFDLYISVDEVKDFDYEKLYRKEKAYRRSIQPRLTRSTVFVKDLSKSIERMSGSNTVEPSGQLINCQREHLTVREILFSAPGLLVSEKKPDKNLQIMESLLGLVKDGLMPEYVSLNPVHHESGRWTGDGSLLLINYAYLLYRETKNIKFVEEKLYEPFRDIIDTYRKGTRENIYIDRDGLLVTGSFDVNTSWIPLKDKAGKVLRYGKLLEMNGLWYNALKIMEYFSRQLKLPKLAGKYADMARVVLKSFLKVFWDFEKIRFSDVVRDNYRDSSLRVNQLFLIGLPFSILDRELGNNVLTKIEDDLLTPLGIRSLATNDPAYTGRFAPDGKLSPEIIYNGSIWPWAIGLYCDAVLQIRGEQQHVINRLLQYLDGFKKTYSTYTISCLPELFSGERPHIYGGCLAYLPAMCEVLRSTYKIEKIRK